jgi:drug/metabolite transporter (DMT)-like permease
MIAVVLLWGTTFVLVKAALAAISPQWFNALRMMLAFACLALLYRRQWFNLTPTAWWMGATAGLFLATGYFFQTQGLVYTTPTNSAFITALVVVLVPCLVSLPVLRPAGTLQPTWIARAGALTAFAGVALLTVPARAPWRVMLASMNRGDLLTLACAMAFSLHLLTLAHTARRVPFEQIALLQIGFAMIFLTAGALLTEPPAHFDLAAHTGHLMTPMVLCALLVTGILATAAAFSIQTWAQQIIPATNMAIILTLEPVFAWLTAFLFVHARMALRPSLGALLVLLAILATEILPRWQRRNDPVRQQFGNVGSN